MSMRQGCKGGMRRDVYMRLPSNSGRTWGRAGNSSNNGEADPLWCRTLFILSDFSQAALRYGVRGLCQLHHPHSIGTNKLMLVVCTTAPLWTDAYSVVVSKLVSLGLVEDAANLPVVCEDAPAVGASVDDNEELAKATRKSHVGCYKAIALAAERATYGKQDDGDETMLAQLPHPRCVLVFLDESTHNTEAARKSLVTHVRAFCSCGGGKPMLHLIPGNAPLDFLWLSPKWSWRCASSGATEFKAQRPSWLSGWLFGRFSVADQLVHPITLAGREDVRRAMRRARTELEARRAETEGSEEEECQSPAGPPLSSAEWWSGAVTMEVSPFDAQPLQQLSGCPLFVVLEDDSGRGTGGSFPALSASRLLTYWHRTSCYPVLVCRDDVKWREWDHVALLARCGIRFTVVRLADSSGGSVCAYQSETELECDGSSRYNEGFAPALRHSNFGMAALAAATTCFLSCALQTSEVEPQPWPGPDRCLWRWFDPLLPPSFVASGPFQCVEKSELTQPSREDSVMSRPLLTVHLPVANCQEARHDSRAGVLQQPPSAKGEVVVPREWAATWSRLGQVSVERGGPCMHTSSIELLGQSVTFSVFDSAPSAVQGAGRPPPDRALALLLPAALRVVPKRLLDEASVWLAEGKVKARVTFQRSTETTPTPAPVLHVTLSFASSSSMDSTVLTLFQGNVASAHCTTCTRAGGHGGAACVHVAALCVLCSETVLVFSGDAGQTAKSQVREPARPHAEGPPLLRQPPTIPNTILGPTGIPLFMTAGRQPHGRLPPRRQTHAAAKREGRLSSAQTQREEGGRSAESHPTAAPAPDSTSLNAFRSIHLTTSNLLEESSLVEVEDRHKNERGKRRREWDDAMPSPREEE